MAEQKLWLIEVLVTANEDEVEAIDDRLGSAVCVPLEHEGPCTTPVGQLFDSDCGVDQSGSPAGQRSRRRNLRSPGPQALPVLARSGRPASFAACTVTNVESSPVVTFTRLAVATDDHTDLGNSLSVKVELGSSRQQGKPDGIIVTAFPPESAPTIDTIDPLARSDVPFPSA